MRNQNATKKKKNAVFTVLNISNDWNHVTFDFYIYVDHSHFISFAQVDVLQQATACSQPIHRVLCAISLSVYREKNLFKKKYDLVGVKWNCVIVLSADCL